MPLKAETVPKVWHRLEFFNKDNQEAGLVFSKKEKATSEDIPLTSRQASVNL